jgi:hypothetical protein
MYYGENDSDRTNIAYSFLHEYMPSIPDSNKAVVINSAKNYITQIKNAQEQIILNMANCAFGDIIRSPLVPARLKAICTSENYPKLGNDWFKKQLSNKILELSDIDAEILTLRLLELDAEPDIIIKRLLELTGKGDSKLMLNDFVNKKVDQILKDRKSGFEKNIQQEETNKLAQLKDQLLKQKKRELNPQETVWTKAEEAQLEKDPIINQNLQDKKQELEMQKTLWLNELSENDKVIKVKLQQILNNKQLQTCKSTQPKLKDNLQKLATQLRILRVKLNRLHDKLFLLRNKLESGVKTK